MPYTPDSRGLADYGRSSEVGQLCQDAARQGAAWANQQHPAGDYQTRPAVIATGHNNEPRAGAIIEETGRSGAQERILQRAVNEIERNA